MQQQLCSPAACGCGTPALLTRGRSRDVETGLQYLLVVIGIAVVDVVLISMLIGGDFQPIHGSLVVVVIETLRKVVGCAVVVVVVVEAKLWRVLGLLNK